MIIWQAVRILKNDIMKNEKECVVALGNFNNNKNNKDKENTNKRKINTCNSIM